MRVEQEMTHEPFHLTWGIQEGDYTSPFFLIGTHPEFRFKVMVNFGRITSKYQSPLKQGFFDQILEYSNNIRFDCDLCVDDA